MILHWGNQKKLVRVLLDMGCSMPLVSQQLAREENLPQMKREESARLRNCSGDVAPGRGEEVTKELTLQHRRHFTREIIDVTPRESEVDMFLPFWWIARHPPGGAWDSTEMRFNSPECIEKCTHFEAADFSLSLDKVVAGHPESRVIGYISAVGEQETNALDLVPEGFRGYLAIMAKEAAEALPENRGYDGKIDLKTGETAPWGPIYPLSEKELEALREWLKERL